jgi:hypothetical protein
VVLYTFRGESARCGLVMNNDVEITHIRPLRVVLLHSALPGDDIHELLISLTCQLCSSSRPLRTYTSPYQKTPPPRITFFGQATYPGLLKSLELETPLHALPALDQRPLAALAGEQWREVARALLRIVVRGEARCGSCAAAGHGSGLRLPCEAGSADGDKRSCERFG